MTVAAIAARYAPLDELLTRRGIRILRALRRFDGASSLDLSYALDVPESEWNAHIATLGYLVRTGHVDRSTRRPYVYRINNRGRRYLAAELARGLLP